MVASPVARVAVPAHPAPRHDRLVLLGLRQARQVADLAPVAALGRVRDYVRSEADGVLAVGVVHRISRVAVGDEDVEAALHPADVRDEPPVDLLAGESGYRHELPAVDGLAQVVRDLLATHPGGSRGGDAQ